MSDYETLIYETRGPIGLLTLNRPDRVNALSSLMTRELDHFWNARRHDPEVRVIVFTGAGEKGFCSGLDLNEAREHIFNQDSEIDLDLFYRSQVLLARTILAMRQIPQPIVCALFGASMGGGFSLALGADIRLVTPEAWFNAQYINIGLGGADVGSSYFLPRLIPAGRAYEFLLTGDAMDAPTAYALGLVSRIVPREQLMDEAMAMAERMARKNPLGLRLTKEAINCNLDAAGLEQALNLEDRNQALCFATIRYEGQSGQTA
ncbi:MAG: enoyl-CoA hydratase/isomerase family protein [Proteobacteria bacterium]|nr:enoyl-CoA hydratase/isomerase family protein [Pseudomonadota bacterium]